MDATNVVFTATLGFLLVLITTPRVVAQKVTALPAPSRTGSMSVEEALRLRRSVREFDSQQLTLRELGQLAWAAQGVTSPDGSRTAPSAGALYPLEVIVVATRVKGLQPGTFRYNPRRHALVRIGEASRSAEKALARAALDQDFIARAPAVFVITGVEKRTSGKYGSRAERYVSIEAGCAAENLLLEAVGLGLGAVPIGAFSDSRVARILALGDGEAPFLILPVGRPR